MRASFLCLVALLTACGDTPKRTWPRVAPRAPTQRATDHRGDDDLLSAGLGLAGLQSATPPPFADVARPTPTELRRRAIWSSWRGIADVASLAAVANVPGREFTALLTLPTSKQPHRVVVQVPDGFDLEHRCLVVAASSGSRGVYGAIAVAGAWGLPRGCAVAYTDKGAGSDYFDLASDTGVRLDGTRGTRGEALAFTPASGAGGVAVKHAHSGDNPESLWGKYVLQAAELGLEALHEAYPLAGDFDFESTRVIATGISNGGGAALRAAEVPGFWLDGVVVGEPNVNAPGGRPLFDYATEAALFMPCALLKNVARCASLAGAGMVTGTTLSARADNAREILRTSGFTDEALATGTDVTAADLWRAIAVSYASAYSAAGPADHPCGYRLALLAEDGAERQATESERAAWYADASGIPPGSGVAIVDTKASGDDPTFAGLECLRKLVVTPTVGDAIAATRAELARPGLPVLIVHGTHDGLIPEAFSSAPYVAVSRMEGRVVRAWRVEGGQHFDAFLARPGYRERYVALLPHVHAALDALWTHLDGTTPMPADQWIAKSRP
ncbi:MAG: 3-hydroxybutyrate oligomer hydrolase family protein [Myxococcota bacterium]|nr:3-hydroxybutyrate oligomer hydrolase family protein [Myxococcota bacterium]